MARSARNFWRFGDPHPKSQLLVAKSQNPKLINGKSQSQIPKLKTRNPKNPKLITRNPKNPNLKLLNPTSQNKAMPPSFYHHALCSELPNSTLTSMSSCPSSRSSALSVTHALRTWRSSSLLMVPSPATAKSPQCLCEFCAQKWLLSFSTVQDFSLEYDNCRLIRKASLFLGWGGATSSGNPYSSRESPYLRKRFFTCPFILPKDSEKSKVENFSPPPLQDALKIFRPPFDLKFQNTPKPIKTPENIEFQWSEKNRSSLKFFALLWDASKIFRPPPL